MHCATKSVDLGIRGPPARGKTCNFPQIRRQTHELVYPLSNQECGNSSGSHLPEFTESCTSQRDQQRTNHCQIQGTVEIIRGTISRKLEYSCTPRARHSPNKAGARYQGIAEECADSKHIARARRNCAILPESFQYRRMRMYPLSNQAAKTGSCTLQRRTGTDRQEARRRGPDFHVRTARACGSRGFRNFLLPLLPPLAPLLEVSSRLRSVLRTPLLHLLLLFLPRVQLGLCELVRLDEEGGGRLVDAITGGRQRRHSQRGSPGARAHRVHCRENGDCQEPDDRHSERSRVSSELHCRQEEDAQVLIWCHDQDDVSQLAQLCPSSFFCIFCFWNSSALFSLAFHFLSVLER